MDHLVMESKSESELESESRRPIKSKGQEWKRKGLLSGLWQIRSSSSFMLVEQSATRISDSAIISELKASFTIYRSILRINQFRLYNQISFEGFQDLRPAAQQLQQPSQSQASTHYGSVSSVLSHSGQVGGFSGHRLNINHFTQPTSSDSGVKEIISLSHRSQSPSSSSGALGSTHRYRSCHVNCTFIVCTSCTSHSHTGHLVNVNGGDIKIKGQKMVTYVTHRVVMNITFLIVDDVVNPITGLDHFKMKFSFICFRVARHTFNKEVIEQCFTTSKITTIPQVWSFKVTSRVLFFSDPEYTLFWLQSRIRQCGDRL